MFAKSAIVSLALLSVASPVFSVPVPVTSTTELDARAIPAGLVGLLKSLGSGVLSGGAISGLLALLGGDDDAAAARRSVEDLTDDQVITLLEWLGEQSNAGELEARGGVPPGILTALKNVLLGLFKGAARRDLEGLEARGGVPPGILTALKNVLLGLFKGAARRDLEGLEARGGVPPGILTALKNVLLGLFKGAARRDLEGLEARGGVPPGILTALKNVLLGLFKGAARRDLNDLSEDQIVALTEWLEAQSAEELSTREVAGLTDTELNTLLEWVNEQVNGKSARGISSLNDLD